MYNNLNAPSNAVAHTCKELYSGTGHETPICSSVPKIPSARRHHSLA